jgi:hypothetical protein
MTENYCISRSRWNVILTLLALAVVLMSGCGQHVDKISDINGDPGKYLGQNVTLAGQATEVYGLPLGISSIAAYKLDDGSGSIWVITHDGAPEKGTKLGLKGVVKSISEIIPKGPLDMIDQFFGNIVDEQQRQSQ